MRDCPVATRPSVNEASGPKGCFRAIRSWACDLLRCDACSSDCRVACESSALQRRLEKRCKALSLRSANRKACDVRIRVSSAAAPVRNRREFHDLREEDGGARRNRTADLLNAIQALSQLSYGPTVAATLGSGWNSFCTGSGGALRFVAAATKRSIGRLSPGHKHECEARPAFSFAPVKRRLRRPRRPRDRRRSGRRRRRRLPRLLPGRCRRRRRCCRRPRFRCRPRW